MDFKIYPDAGHGFASSKDPKVYRPEDAKDAEREGGRVSGEGAGRLRAGGRGRHPGRGKPRPYFWDLYQSALTCWKCFHLSGIVSSVKIAVTGQAGSQLPHWMQTSGSM